MNLTKILIIFILLFSYCFGKNGETKKILSADSSEEIEEEEEDEDSAVA
jgi:hypothetical protein